jgi:hypothetical protein
MNRSEKGGLIYLAFIGLFLASIGGVFVVVLWGGFQKARMTMAWREVPATIVSSTIKELRIGPSVPIEYSHELSYEYVIEGKSYFGSRVRLRENPSSKERKKVEMATQFWKQGSKVKAFVNPVCLEEAVLEHESRAPLYTIWFPVLFLGGGLGIFLRAIFKFCLSFKC